MATVRIQGIYFAALCAEHSPSDMVFDAEGYHAQSHAKERSDRTITTDSRRASSPDLSEEEDSTPSTSRTSPPTTAILS